jgi:hypothetical protein
VTVRVNWVQFGQENNKAMSESAAVIRISLLLGQWIVP